MFLSQVARHLNGRHVHDLPVFCHSLQCSVPQSSIGCGRLAQDFIGCLVTVAICCLKMPSPAVAHRTGKILTSTCTLGRGRCLYALARDSIHRLRRTREYPLIIHTDSYRTMNEANRHAVHCQPSSRSAANTGDTQDGLNSLWTATELNHRRPQFIHYNYSDTDVTNNLAESV